MGLIFVGISINLKNILSIKGLDLRASISMFLLLGILIISLLMLAPFEPSARGLLVLITACFIWLATIIFDIKIYKGKQATYKRHYLINMLFNQAATIPNIVAGSLIFNANENGFYFTVPAIIFSIIKAVLDAWVLLVEINR